MPPRSKLPRPPHRQYQRPDRASVKIAASAGGERNPLLVPRKDIRGERPLPQFDSHQDHLEHIRNTVLQAADPARRVAANLQRREHGFIAAGHPVHLGPTSRLFVVGLGKAAAAMATAAAEALGSRINRGIVAVPQGTQLPAPDRMTFIAGGHPQPDQGSLECGRAVEAMLAETSSEDVVLTLVSGGGSAMLESPVSGVSLSDLQLTTAALIRSGAPIREINIVRSALSRIKSGGLARLASPARCVTLILSDVVEDRLSSIASGPTVLRAPSPRLALRVLERHNLWAEIPSGVQEALTLDRPRPNSAPRPRNILIGSNRLVIDAAHAAASELGFPVRVLSRQMQGEARQVGHRMASRMARAARPGCLILGGETTVHVQGNGRGGRNQELAMAAALELDGCPDVALMALATDGVDGPTDAAGAVVTGETAARAREQRLDLEAALAHNDAYPCLDRLGALIRTGPTGTNLNDILVGLVYAS